MEDFTIYQCIPAYKPIPTVRLINSIFRNSKKCKIHLDIEDGIQDIKRPSLTSTLKKKARCDFKEIVKNLPGKKISLRINAINSPEFQYDKTLLHKYSENIETVFLPKIETINDLTSFKQEFGDNFELCLIIESQKGIDNLDKILSSGFSRKIKFVFFGNYDYHLDKKTFPIVEQNTKEYWQTAGNLIRIVENHNLNFGNSPYTKINDTYTLKFAVSQLSKLCKRNFAVMSLHKTQTYFYQALLDKPGNLRHYFYSSSNSANKNSDITLNNFNSHIQKGRSFSFYKNRIITPQEYLLIKLKEDENN